MRQLEFEVRNGTINTLIIYQKRIIRRLLKSKYKFALLLHFLNLKLHRHQKIKLLKYINPSITL